MIGIYEKYFLFDILKHITIIRASFFITRYKLLAICLNKYQIRHFLKKIPSYYISVLNFWKCKRNSFYEIVSIDVEVCTLFAFLITKCSYRIHCPLTSVNFDWIIVELRTIISFSLNYYFYSIIWWRTRRFLLSAQLH